MGNLLGKHKGRSSDAKEKEISRDILTARRATLEDRFDVVRLLRDSHAFAKFHFKFDAARAEQLFISHLNIDHVAAFVFGSPAQGLLMARAFDHPFGAGLCAMETVFYVSPSARGRAGLSLLNSYEEWAKTIGCAMVGMASLAVNDVSRLYERRGFKAVETHFMKVL